MESYARSGAARGRWLESTVAAQRTCPDPAHGKARERNPSEVVRIPKVHGGCSLAAKALDCGSRDRRVRIPPVTPPSLHTALCMPTPGRRLRVNAHRGRQVARGSVKPLLRHARFEPWDAHMELLWSALVGGVIGALATIGVDHVVQHFKRKPLRCAFGRHRLVHSRYATKEQLLGEPKIPMTCADCGKIVKVPNTPRP